MERKEREGGTEGKETEVKEGRKKERKGKTVENASLIDSLWGIHPTGGQHRAMRHPLPHYSKRVTGPEQNELEGEVEQARVLGEPRSAWTVSAAGDPTIRKRPTPPPQPPPLLIQGCSEDQGMMATKPL